jgi:tetratricopeptide (TPR) repeat protein
MCRKEGRGDFRAAARLALAGLVLAGGSALPVFGAAAGAGVVAGTAGGRTVVSSAHLTGVELSATVQQVLQQIQDQWPQWVGASNRERAGQVVDNLLTTVRQIGMRRLPDLSLGALVQAEKAARQRDFARAHWALEGAERLDPGRPEVAFATASVDSLEGNYFKAFFDRLSGYLRLFRFPLERYLWGQSLVLWGLSALLLTGGLFTALQMATKGGALYRDLSNLVGRRLPGKAGLAVAAALLVWPLVLPYGPLWLLLYWSVLLWGYAATSERVVLISLWLLLGLAPVVVAEQRRHLALDLSPPVLAMESFAERRLYGSLFTDLGVLRSLLPESTAVQQLLGDFHRSLNQWDLARSLYRQVLEKEPGNTAVHLDIGDYFYFRADYGSAIQSFEKAAANDPTSAAAQFNLSQAYSESYLFDEQKQALERARTLNAAAVNDWLKQTEQQHIVALDGGLARAPEIRAQLLASFRGQEAGKSPIELLRRGVSVVFAVALILVAIGLHLGRRRFGYTEPPLDIRLGSSAFDRWRRILLPGVAAAEAGEGGRAYLALLAPAALLTLPLAGDLGYRIPWGYDPGSSILWTFAVLGLLLYFGARLRWELTHQV